MSAKPPLYFLHFELLHVCINCQIEQNEYKLECALWWWHIEIQGLNKSI